LPTASATNRGALSSANWSTFNNKQNAITLTTTGSSGSSTFIADVLNVPTYTLSGLGGVPTSRTITINGTSQDLSADRTYNVGTVTSVAALTLGTSGTDLSSTVANSTTTPVITLNVPTASATNRGVLSSADWTTFNSKQDTITLTTTGTSGAATFIGNTLNIPQYQSVLTNPVTGTGTTNFLPKFTAASAIGDSAITDDGTTVTLVSRALSGTSATFSSSVTVGGSGSTIGNYLKVLGSTANNANYPNIQLVGGTEVNNYPFISLGNGGVNLTIGAGYHTVNYPQRAQIAMDAVNYGISLQTSPSGSPIDRLIVTSGGNVLIGTTTDAGYKLDVNGTGRFSGALTGTSATFSGLNDFINNTAASTTTKFIRIGNTSGDMAIGVEGSTPTQISVADGGISYSTVLKTVGTTSLILGTLSKAALTINTSQQVTLAQALTGTSATFSSGIISTAPSSAIGLELRARSADDFSQMNFTNNAGSNINGSIGVEKVGTNGGLMYFYTKPDGGTIAERMRITSGGDLQLASGVATFNRSGKKIELNANVSNLNVDAEIEITSGMNLFFKLGGSERMRITSGGNVLIGSSTDGGQKFQVAGNMINNVGNNVLVHRVTGATTGYIYGYWTNTSGSLLYGVEGSTAAQLQTGSSPWDAVITTAQANGLSIGVNQVQFMRITSGRQAYISGTGNALNITSDNNTLSLGLGYQGTYSGYLGGFGSALYGYSTNGGYVLLNSSSVWVAASDAKRKRNFETYSNGLSAILGLQPKLYNMDFQKDGDEKQVGLVAQEVKDFIPKAYEDNNNFIGLNYNAIIVTMVNAIKELKAEIDILKNN
jgi:hypothetical protein